MKVKPINGKKVYDPDRGDFLPEEGRNVEYSQYWARRIVDNDVEEVVTSDTKPESKKGDKK